MGQDVMTVDQEDLQARTGEWSQPLEGDHASTQSVIAAGVRTTTETATIIIHDGVLMDPLGYRAKALAMRFQTVADGNVVFQGIAPCADPTIPMWLKTHYPTLDPVTSFFRLSPTGQMEPHAIHTDASMGSATTILYLNPDPPVGDGTNFYRHRVTGATASTATDYAGMLAEGMDWFDPDQWELLTHVAAKFNRIVTFPAGLFHSRAILENYGTGLDGRLIQVVFSEGDLR